MDEILSVFGLNFEEITLDERDDLNRMAAVYEIQQQLTLEDVKRYITEATNEVMLKLAVEPEGTINNVHLKARLLNYTMLLGVLSGPQRAREELAKYVERLKTIKKK
jgi:predicted amino acid-binding ACT domain protein